MGKGKIYPSARNLVFTDIETTHLDPQIGEIISLATVVMSPRMEEVARGEWYMHPRWPDNAQPAALKVNGYTREAWEERGPTTHDVALREYNSLAEGGIFIAQNVTFDWGFISVEMNRQGLEWVGDYHRLDTASMVWPMYIHLRGEMKGISLKYVCDHFGISNEGAHDAMTDVERMILAYRANMSRLPLPRPGQVGRYRTAYQALEDWLWDRPEGGTFVTHLERQSQIQKIIRELDSAGWSATLDPKNPTALRIRPHVGEDAQET